MNPLVLLSLIPTWAYKWIAVALVVGAAWGHGYIKGSSGARAVCEEKARQAQVAADKQDRKAQDQISVQEKSTDAELAELAKKQAARIKELEANATLTSPACVYPMPDPVKHPVPRGVRARPG